MSTLSQGVECLVAANKRKLRVRDEEEKKEGRFLLQLVQSYFDETLLETRSRFERYRNWFERQSNVFGKPKKISVWKRWKINQSPGRYRSNCLAQRKATVNFPEEIDLFPVCRDNSPSPSSHVSSAESLAPFLSALSLKTIQGVHKGPLQF